MTEAENTTPAATAETTTTTEAPVMLPKVQTSTLHGSIFEGVERNVDAALSMLTPREVEVLRARFAGDGAALAVVERGTFGGGDVMQMQGAPVAAPVAVAVEATREVLSAAEQELLRRHREGNALAEAAPPPRAWGGPPGDPNGNPDDAVLMEVGATVELLPPSRGILGVDCSALRIELNPDNKPVRGKCTTGVRRARYHDELDTIEVDFDSHGRAVVPVLRLRFISAPQQ